MTFKSISIAGLVALVGVGVAWQVSAPSRNSQEAKTKGSPVAQASRHPNATAASNTSELAALRSSVRAQSRELEKLRNAGGPESGLAANEKPAADPDEQLSSPSPEEQREQEARDGDRVIAAFDSVFLDEARDGAWASAKEGALAAAFESDDVAGARLVRAECKAQLCRVVVDTTRADRDNVLQNLMRTEAFGTSGFYGPDPDDPAQIRMFVSREGTSLGDHPGFNAALGDANG